MEPTYAITDKYEWFLKDGDSSIGPLKFQTIPEILERPNYNLETCLIAHTNQPDKWDPISENTEVLKILPNRPKPKISRARPDWGSPCKSDQETTPATISAKTLLLENNRLNEIILDEEYQKQERIKKLVQLKDKDPSQLSDVEKLITDSTQPFRELDKVPSSFYVSIHETYEFFLTFAFQAILGFLLAIAHFYKPTLTQIIVFCTFFPITLSLSTSILRRKTQKIDFSIKETLLGRELKNKFTAIITFLIITAYVGTGLTDIYEDIPEEEPPPIEGELSLLENAHLVFEHIEYNRWRMQANLILGFLNYQAKIGGYIETAFEYANYPLSTEYISDNPRTRFQDLAFLGFYLTTPTILGFFLFGVFSRHFLTTHTSGFFLQFQIILFPMILIEGVVIFLIIIAASFALSVHMTQLFRYAIYGDKRS